MKKFIIGKKTVEEVDAELIFDLTCPPDLKIYKINKDIYYSWALFDSKELAEEHLEKLVKLKNAEK